MDRSAEVMNCKWLEDNKLKNAVLDSLKNDAKLPTSLNMRDFAKATNNIANEKRIDELSLSTPLLDKDPAILICRELYKI